MRAGRQETGFMTAPSGRRHPARGAGPGRVQCPRGASRARAMGRRARSARGTFSSRARRARAQIDVDFCIRRRPHLGSLAERRGGVVNPVPSERTAPFGSPVEASSLEAGKSAGCGRRDNGVVGRASELYVAGCEDKLASVPRDWLPSDRARDVQPTYLHPPHASWVVQVPFGRLSLISSVHQTVRIPWPAGFQGRRKVQRGRIPSRTNADRLHRRSYRLNPECQTLSAARGPAWALQRQTSKPVSACASRRNNPPKSSSTRARIGTAGKEKGGSGSFSTMESPGMGSDAGWLFQLGRDTGESRGRRLGHGNPFGRNRFLHDRCPRPSTVP